MRSLRAELGDDVVDRSSSIAVGLPRAQVLGRAISAVPDQMPGRVPGPPPDGSVHTLR